MSVGAGLNLGAEAIRLSVREKQIVGQWLQAPTNRQIADELKIREKTVKHSMTALMIKLNARDSVEVVIAAQHQVEQVDRLRQ